MSTISNSPALRQTLAGSFFRAVGRGLRDWWITYIDWRFEQLAISRLRSMSDRELKDIGVSRAEIEFAVKGRADRHPVLNRY